MQTIRLVLLGFLLLLLVFTGAGLLQRADWSAERSRVLANPPDAVHRWLDLVERWPAMLAGEGAPPATYSTNAVKHGPGAELAAKSHQGTWTLLLERSDPSTGIDYRIEFAAAMEPVHGTLRWSAEGSGTRVTVTEGGAVGWGPIERFLRGVIENGHGQELDRRLERLERALSARETGTAVAPR